MRKNFMGRTVGVIGTRGYPSYYGGFETAVRKISPYLASRGWDVTVYGRRGAVVDDDASIEASVRSVLTTGVDSKSLSTLSYGLTAVIHALRKKPDVALVMNVANGFWIPLLRLRGIPVVVNVDGIEWERQKWGPAAKAVFKAGAWMTSKFANELIADALEIQNYWLTHFGRTSRYIPYGGDEVPPLPVMKGLQTAKYILMVARFVPENSVPEFLKAVERLATDYKVVIVGSSGYGGPLDSDAADLAEKFENVSWLGHISNDRELHSLWQHAGVYFHGHSVGGTNPALVQAMACGAPVVARDTVYNREVLGEHGVFVEPKVEEIGRALRAVMRDENLRKRLSLEGQRRAASSFTWLSVCNEYEKSLRAQIIAER